MPATWSQANMDKIKNVLQARSQASQNMATGGQLLQQGIGQLGQGVNAGLDFLQNERARQSQENQANLERGERARQFNESAQFQKDAASGVYTENVLNRFGAAKNMYNRTLAEYGWEPKGYGNDKDKKDPFFDDLESSFSGLAAGWADENSLKGKDGKSIVAPGGKIADWGPVDFAELQKRLVDYVGSKADWTPEQKTIATEYSKKWIKYRMRDALTQVIEKSGQTPNNFMEGIIQLLQGTTLQGHLQNQIDAMKKGPPPKNANELALRIMDANFDTSFIAMLLRIGNLGKQGEPDYAGFMGLKPIQTPAPVQKPAQLPGALNLLNKNPGGLPGQMH